LSFLLLLLQSDAENVTSTGRSAEDQTAAGQLPPPPKRFKFAARPPQDSEGERTSTKDSDLSLYLIELNTLPEDTNALDYWHIKQSQFRNISQLALDLISAPSSQAYVERVFSVCGDLSARKRNRAKAGMERRVFLKLNKRELAKVNA
jgi:hypothetical protein